MKSRLAILTATIGDNAVGEVSKMWANCLEGKVSIIQ